MKVLILNGNPVQVPVSGSGSSSSASLDEYLDRLSGLMREKSIEVTILRLGDLKLNYCIGCWNCWLRTPGQCVFHDDMELILRQILKHDMVIFAAPLRLGFLHHMMKKAIDRIIPLVLPFIGIYKGECHHYLRYPQLPLIGVLLEKEPDTDLEDLEINYHIFKRLSLNLRSRLVLTQTTQTSPEEVLHEISRI
jgi:hypothetical protein